MIRGNISAPLGLLLLDEGDSAEEVAGYLHVCRRTVYNWARRFERREALAPALRLLDGPRSGRPPTAQGIIDPLIEAVIDEDPRDHGYNSTVWTAALLRRYLWEAHRQAAGRRSIGRAMARLRLRWKHPRHELGRRAPFWRQAKGGSKSASGRIPARSLSCWTKPSSPKPRPCIAAMALLLIADVWDEVTHQYFLQMVRAHWRGWHIILFEDRGSPHTAEDSLELAKTLGIQVRLLPTACPELNAMDHLFRFVKGRGVSNHPARSIDASAMAACRCIYALPWHERLAKAGVLSGDFWLLPGSH